MVDALMDFDLQKSVGVLIMRLVVVSVLVSVFVGSQPHWRQVTPITAEFQKRFINK